MACLFRLGNIPSLNDMFIIATRRIINNSENSMSRLVKMLLGPLAFENFKFPIITWSDRSVQGFMKMLLLFEFNKCDEKLVFECDIVLSRPQYSQKNNLMIQPCRY